MNALSKPLFCICFLLCSIQGFTQVSYEEFRKQSDLNIKSEMGLELWNYYIRSDLDSLKIAAVDLLLLASEKEHDFARAAGTRMMGSYLYRSGKIEQGLEYLNIACSFFERKEDFMITSEIYNEIGHAYLLQGDYEEAKKAYNKSLDYGRQSTDETDAYNAKYGLGRAYIATGDTSAGMTLLHSYKQRSLQSRKYEAVSDVYAFMAMVESARGDRELSIEYYMQSVANSRRSKSKVHLGHSYANMGILKFELGEYDSSLYYFKESLRLRTEVKAIRPMIEGYYNLGFFYMERDSIPQAIEHFEQALGLSREYVYLQDEIDVLSELVHIYKALGDTTRVKEYEVRRAAIAAEIESGSMREDEELNGIDLDFEAKKEGGEPMHKGLGWVTFVILSVGALLLMFFFLERKRFLSR